MKRKAIYGLQLVIGLLLAFAAGGIKSPGLDVVMDQFDVIGPRQWLTLLTGSVGAGWSRSVAGPIAGRIAIRPRETDLAPANDNTRADTVARAG